MAMAYPSTTSSFPQTNPEIEIEAESQLPHCYRASSFANDVSFGPSTSTAAHANENTNNNYQCDIFINHRGPDVKKTFASHLYRRLLLHGVRAFLDYQEMQEGENISSQIKGAIATAHVHVAIFSLRYAESHWCLNELLIMLESGAPIIPVFYNVRPADLRHGLYADDLKKLEKKTVYDPETQKDKPRYNFNTIENWRKALANVSELSGLELDACNGDEGELLDKVVSCLLKKVKRTHLNVAKYPTGLDEKVIDFENTVLFQQPSGKSRVVGIVGLGGVGKTTLAKELFNRKSSYYPKSCFLTDVRENAAKGCLNVLQSKIFKSLTGLDDPIDSIDKGIEMLKKHFSTFSHGLLVFDDVDSGDQLDALLPVQVKEVLPSNWLILITSRDKDILLQSGVQEPSIYQLTGLDTHHSRELFCSYAFCQPHPPEGFEDLVDKLLGVCHGLPLSLKVFGTLLSGNHSKPYWEDQLNNIQLILPTDIEKKLKISYDSLNREEQQIFLDTACFFIGEKLDTAIRSWDKLGCKSSLRFQNLQNKFLVEVDSENCIHMHDHFRKLGRKIAEESGSFMPSLWCLTQNMNIDDLLEQSCNQQINTQVRGIRVVPNTYKGDDDFKHCAFLPWYKRRNHELLRNLVTKPLQCKISMWNLQFLVTEDDILDRILRKARLPNLKWLRWYKCGHSSLPSWIPMEELRVMHVEGSALKSLWHSKSQAPLQLRELEIMAPLSKFPKSIGKLKYLEQIYVSLGEENNVKTLPDEFCDLLSLKRLEFINAWKMKLLPDSFGNLTNLEHINLSFSHNLQRLPGSFRKLTRLKYLDLRESYNLTITTTETLVKNNPLQFLNLSRSGSLLHRESKTHVLLPSWLSSRIFKVRRPRKSNAEAIGLHVQKAHLCEDMSAEKLGMGAFPLAPSSSGAEEPVLDWGEILPEELGIVSGAEEPVSEREEEPVAYCGYSMDEAQSLLALSLSSSSQEMEVISQYPLPPLRSPVRHSLLLEELHVTELPSGIKNMINLEVLELRSSLLEKLPPSLMGLRILRELRLVDCMELKYLPDSLGLLTELVVHGCHGLFEVGTLPNTLMQLELICCEGLKKIKGLSGLAKLLKLNITGCPKVQELPSIETLVSLEELTLRDMNLKRIRGLAQLTKLRLLDVSGCGMMEELESVENLRSLEKLDASGCPRLQWDRGVLENLPQRLKAGMFFI